jgi:hypothetical protein
MSRFLALEIAWFMLFGSSAKLSIATTAASEVSQSVPPKDDPAEPPTDDKDTSPTSPARSGSTPSPSAPSGDSSMFFGSPENFGLFQKPIERGA